ncbi:MFS transporter [Limnohabitans sp.]|uniref:MFS transporter n=1 Tax=Limnohabitans sp. TaxID=1907725 RepID=UPI00286F62E7|nr:MFS transporter [Limnohabitans sp.]
MKRELTRLIAGQICLHACMAGMRMSAPLMALRSGQSEAAVGVLLALFALTQVFLALPAGRYADAHGLKRPVMWSVLMAFTGAGLAALWPIFPVLCVSALLTGGATGGAIIALQRHVGRAVQDVTQMKQAFSWLSIGPAFSNFIGPFTAGILIDHAGFQWAYAAMAVLPLLGWLCIRRTRELPPVIKPDGHEKNRAWDLLNAPMFRRLLMVNWFLSACWDVHTFVVPILGHERGLSASAIGSILGGFAIAAALIRMLLPILAARMQEWQVITGAMLITSALLGVYPLMHTAWTMGACSVLLGLSLGSVQPMVMSTLHQITPEHRHGEALGLRLMGINASSVLMPILFGAAGTVIGIGGVFWCVSAVVGLGSRSAYMLRVHKTHG